jgi:G3E family GTPase
MSEESAREEAMTSYDPQAEIVHLNKKIVQLEKDLQIRDQTEQQKNEEEQPHNSHASEENENRNVEETVGDESSIDGDTELANLLRENEREKKEWTEKLTKLMCVLMSTRKRTNRLQYSVCKCEVESTGKWSNVGVLFNQSHFNLVPKV